jgi:hypothetical protein
LPRKLTITLDEQVYQDLKRKVGPGQISSFIERLVRAHAVDDRDLEAPYEEMASDHMREAEAMEWLEDTRAGGSHRLTETAVARVHAVRESIAARMQADGVAFGCVQEDLERLRAGRTAELLGDDEPSPAS